MRGTYVRAPIITMLRLFLLTVLLFACLEGCTKADDKNSGGRQAQGGEVSDLSKKLSSLNSANCYLTVGDLDKFQQGRSKSDILKDVQWRGQFERAAEYEGKTVSKILYELFSDDPNRKMGVWVDAMFVDDKFVKFVRWSPPLPEDQEITGYDESGTPYRRPKPLKAGDNRFLIRTMNGEAASIADLKKEANSMPAPPGQHVDPGLTAAFLLMRASGALRLDEPASEKDYLRNAELRDQFNGARVNIGMTEPEVEAVLKAKPLESGRVEAGLYRIYGSNEAFNIDFNLWLHFSNILVIFHDGKAVTVSSIPAGYDWRRELGEATVDLPAPARP